MMPQQRSRSHRIRNSEGKLGGFVNLGEFDPADFPLFRPAGAGTPENAALLTRLSINGLVGSLGELIAPQTGGGRPQRLLDVVKSNDVVAAATALEVAFDLEGSDKGRHGYAPLYGRLFSDLKPEKLFEVGLGTNDVSVPSNMGVEGRPGASLKAFQSVFPQLSVVGADVDPSALEGHAFPCLQLDQLDLASFPSTGSLGRVDIVIDDGLHMPAANINTLAWALGYYPGVQAIVIEDVPDSALPVWDIVAELIAPERGCGIFRGTTANCILIASPEYVESVAEN